MSSPAESVPTPTSTAPAAATSLPAPLLMAISAVFFALMAITMRLASERGLHTFEIAFFRALFGLVFALPLLYKPGLALLRTQHGKLYIMRGATGAISLLGGTWALAHLPLATAVALSYSAPLFVTIGAVLLLGEIVRARRWSAVAIGFVGVLVIMRPGGTEFSPAMLIGLGGALAAASSYISIKFLSRSEPADAIVIWMSFVMALITLPLALWVWTWPDATGWLWCVLIGLLGTAGQITMTRAYHRGDASALAPLNYLQLPVVSLLAYFIFGQTVDVGTIGGAAIIIASNIYIARREAMLAKRAVTDPSLAASKPAQSS